MPASLRARGFRLRRRSLKKFAASIAGNGIALGDPGSHHFVNRVGNLDDRNDTIFIAKVSAFPWKTQQDAIPNK